MSRKLQQGDITVALALSQAACYASMSAKEHEEHTDQAKAMLKLTERLVELTLRELEDDVLPEPDEKE